MSTEHEAKCLRCGRCCQLKTRLRGEVYLMPGFCRFFDVKTRLCWVYEKRHQMNKDCLTVAQALKQGALPPDCPYAREVKGYKPAVVEWKI